MKKFVLLSLFAALIPLCSNAQDDLYFMPKKSNQGKDIAQKPEPYQPVPPSYQQRPPYHSGSNRDVDEYNRRTHSSFYQNIDNDSTVVDIIDFEGNVPDSVYGQATTPLVHRQELYDVDDDYAYTRRMSRFDDFFWYDDPWMYGYYYPYYGYGWGRPWRYGYYAGWYDPWYYGWYDPWYYGWHRPYYGYHYAYRPYNRGGITGTANHGRVNNGRVAYNGFSGYRSNGESARSNAGFSGSRKGNNGGYYNSRYNNQNRNSDNFNYSNRQNSTRDFSNQSSFNNSSFSRSGGFSGGGHSGGGFGGGGRSGGGGHFGGRR